MLRKRNCFIKNEQRRLKTIEVKKKTNLFEIKFQ